MDTSSQGVHTRSIIYGLMQLSLTLAFFLGWFWSIYHGFLLCTHAVDVQYGKAEHPPMNGESSLSRANEEKERFLANNSEPMGM